MWSELTESIFRFFYLFNCGTAGEATTGILKGLMAIIGFVLFMIFGLIATLFMPPKSKKK
jgi:hypothetical protein